VNSFRLHEYDPYEDLSAAIWAGRAPMLDAAYEGDAEALKAALVGCREGAAGDALISAACHADPECVRLILADWGGRLGAYSIDKAVERAAQRGHAETLRALLPYGTVNQQWRETFALRFKDETCAALLRGTAEVAA
jgi:hypothetical protein